MIEQVTWKRSLAAAGVALLMGLSACSSDDPSDAGDDPSSSDTPTSSESTDGTTDEGTDEPSESTSETGKNDPREGGWKALPDCSEFAESIVEGQDIEQGDQVEGKTCRYDVGTERVIGRQVVWLTVHGGDWPTKFKADKLNALLSGAADQGEGDYSSTVEKIKAPGWTYGIKFEEKVGGKKRSTYRLFAFADNGDLLNCNTGLAAAKLGDFVDWCDTVKEAVTP
jgi:hypothetical protein